MRSIHTLLLVMAIGAAHAQNITEYRYWYNDDVVNTVTQTVAGTPALDLAAAFPTTGLEPGFHRITMQFNDGTDWSSPLTQVFKRSSSNITGYRYWLNDDPSTLVTASVTTNAVVNLNDVLSTVPSDSHYNRVTVQFVDADGEYSTPITRLFVHGIGPVSGYEYWIDDAIASRTSGTVGPADVVDLIADLPTNTTDGDHLFTIRFKGEPDGWSAPLTTEYTFFTSVEELPGLTNLTVFPNPTVDQIRVRLTTEGSRQLEVSVMDADGALVQQFPTWNIVGNGQRNWNVESLSSGKYFLRLSDGAHSWTTPFVKQ